LRGSPSIYVINDVTLDASVPDIDVALVSGDEWTDELGRVMA